MTRLDTVRKAAARTSKQAAPYKERAARLAGEARTRVTPHVESAVRRAEKEYRARVAPHVEHALESVPPRLEDAASSAAERGRRAVDTYGPRLNDAWNEARGAAEPKIREAAAAARARVEPVRDEALHRGTAAAAVLRGTVSADDVDKLAGKAAAKKHCSRGRVARRVGLGVLLLGVGVAAWQWWRRQSTPDWLVEDEEATEISASRGGASATAAVPVAPDTGEEPFSVDSVDGSQQTPEINRTPKPGER